MKCGDTASTPRCAGPTVLTSLPLTAPHPVLQPCCPPGSAGAPSPGPHWGPPIPCLFPLSPHLPWTQRTVHRTFCTWHLLPNPRRVNCMRTGLLLAQCSTRRSPGSGIPSPRSPRVVSASPGSPPALRGVAGQQDLLPRPSLLCRRISWKGVRTRGGELRLPPLAERPPRAPSSGPGCGPPGHSLWTMKLVLAVGREVAG